jgi:hypothetical protein
LTIFSCSDGSSSRDDRCSLDGLFERLRRLIIGSRDAVSG